MIDLGPAAAIDAAVSAARKAIADAPAAIRADGEAAAEKKLRDVRGRAGQAGARARCKAVAGSATVWYVAPDGELWLYPWAALPTADGYLAETVDVRYVTSGRDLLPRQVGRQATGDAVIVADPDFDAGSGRERVAAIAPAGGRSVANLLGRVARLPGTAVEANAVAPRLAALTVARAEDAHRRAGDRTATPRGRPAASAHARHPRLLPAARSEAPRHPRRLVQVADPADHGRRRSGQPAAAGRGYSWPGAIASPSPATMTGC